MRKYDEPRLIESVALNSVQCRKFFLVRCCTRSGVDGWQNAARSAVSVSVWSQDSVRCLRSSPRSARLLGTAQMNTAQFNQSGGLYENIVVLAVFANSGNAKDGVARTEASMKSASKMRGH